MLERPDGPVILEDFTEDAPGWQDNPQWQQPLLAPLFTPANLDAWRMGLGRELTWLRPAWRRATWRYGRTTVGLSGAAPSQWPELAARFIAGEAASIPEHETAALALRSLSEDIKAYYSEAGQAEGPPPSSRQLDAWFWRSTFAGSMLMALRRQWMSSENSAMRTVATRFLVPAPWVVE